MLQLLQGHKKEEVYVFLSFQIVCQKVSVALSVRLLDSSFPSASTWAAYGGIKIAQCGCSLGAGWEYANQGIASSSERPSLGRSLPLERHGQRPAFPAMPDTDPGLEDEYWARIINNRGLKKERDRYTTESTETRKRGGSQASFCRIFLRT